MAKKKATKEEVIVDVQQVYNKSEEFVEKNSKVLSMVIGGLLLVFILFFGYKYFIVNPNQESAVTELYKSQMYFMQDSLDLALTGDGVYAGTEDVSDQFSNTSAGMLADYMSAITYRNQGTEEGYRTALELFKKCDFDDAIIGVVAMGNVGDMYVELDELAEGAKWLEDAGRKAQSTLAEDFSAPLYLMKAAQVRMELEEYDKAKDLLSTIVNDYPQWKNHDMAVKYLGSINSK